MNAKKFSDAMSELDTKYVDEALNYKKKAKRPGWIKWGAMAACVAAAILVGVRIVAPEKDGLPMLTIPDVESSGMGFEGWLGYDISQWDNGNPWSESMEFSVLPVYRNGSYDAAGKPVVVVAGAEEKAEEGCTFEAALDLVRARMAEGLSTKDAVKQVAKLTGFAKNLLYDAVVK